MKNNEYMEDSIVKRPKSASISKKSVSTSNIQSTESSSSNVQSNKKSLKKKKKRLNPIVESIYDEYEDDVSIIVALTDTESEPFHKKIQRLLNMIVHSSFKL
jgi:peptidoglycan hydrolase CwlO-like protein